MGDDRPGSTGIELSRREIDEARVDLLLMLLAGVQWWVSLALLAQALTRGGVVSMLGGAVVGLALIILPRVRRRRLERTTLRSLVWRTIWIVTMSVLSQVGGATILAAGITEASRPLGFQGNLGPTVVLAVFMVVVHTAAAIIVPWTVLEACVPPALWAGLTFLASQGAYDSPGFIALGVALTLLAGAPGIAITCLRAGGLRATLGFRLIGARYAEIERELIFARRLHERLFPRPVREGPIRVEYMYEPMRQIGGDFLDVTLAQDGSLLIVMIDVTGHGVAAALAVNRLHGEVKRLLAESRDSTPASIITALNRYVHLTLADESVFATAVAAHVRPNGLTRLCVAGHPPPLVRAEDGSVTSIQSTAPILGPFTPEEFEAEETELRLSPGVALVLYTDGAVECRDAQGRDLGQAALERVLATTAAEPEDLPKAMLQHVMAWRAGPAEDDVLIAAITAAPAARQSGAAVVHRRWPV